MDPCINKFLKNYNQVNVDKHSDSSDFDETIPCKIANSPNEKSISRNKTKKVNIVKGNTPVRDKELHNPNFLEDSMIPVRDVNTNQIRKKLKKEDNKSNDKINEGLSPKSLNYSKDIQCRPTPRFSNIFRRSSNYEKRIPSVKEIPEDNLNNGTRYCVDCERRRVKNLNRRRRSFVVQPVHVVDNVQGGPVPFGHANDRAPLSRRIHKVVRKQDSSSSYELTSSESEIGKIDQREHVTRRRNFIDRFQNEMRREYIKYERELLKHRVQQYPSKRDNNLPYQVFSTPYITVNAGTSPNNEQSNIPSTASGFWEYIFEKIRGKPQPQKDQTSKSCYCYEGVTSPPELQNVSLNTEEQPYPKLKERIPECKSCIAQTEDQSERLSKTPTRKSGPQNVTCKCHANMKRPNADPLKDARRSTAQDRNVNKPCQEPHDDIIRTVEEKYNGEILCIHNPPCILINGCLNLPYAAETPTIQGNLWPVTRDKKMSLYHMCRKMKRPKRTEQACQYHPPSADVEAMRVKTEKIVQSICNHDPPCEVVYGCYKAKYDPKLDNSCVHVPMCQRLPECLVGEMEKQEKHGTEQSCEHKPKCTELPMCSRKFVVLTAKETTGTQVRPKSKLVCRHVPPCIMIPKCLARIISDSFIPYDAIPGCVHQPSCDMIPACCRRAAKGMVSVSSQYPNAPCRIV